MVVATGGGGGDGRSAVLGPRHPRHRGEYLGGAVESGRSHRGRHATLVSKEAGGARRSSYDPETGTLCLQVPEESGNAQLQSHHWHNFRKVSCFGADQLIIV